MRRVRSSYHGDEAFYQGAGSLTQPDSSQIRITNWRSTGRNSRKWKRRADAPQIAEPQVKNYCRSPNGAARAESWRRRPPADQQRCGTNPLEFSMKYLFDVNALVALGFLEHEFHLRVARWVSTSTPSIATCSITELGFVRVLAQALDYGLTVHDARKLLRRLKAVNA